MTSTGTDLATLLQRDHTTVKALLEGFDAVAIDERERAFGQIVNELVRHEVSEEEVLYPALRRQAANGDAVADARIAEQSEAEELLATMEKEDVKSATFMAKFDKLRSAVLAHAEAEEATAIPALAAAASPDELAELGQRYESAKKLAPTHPHPNAPDSPPGNVLLGPVAAMFDKARDAMRGSQSS